jgi:hypothetical protein
VSLRVEAWFEGGVLRGVLVRHAHLRDALESSTELLIERATWVASGERAPRQAGDARVAVDDVILAVSDEPAAGPVHATWHPIRLEAGPCVIEGDLATMPGFDPGRALTRPTGTFVLLSGVRVSRIDNPAWGEQAFEHAWVNRYAVDAVQSDLMLGFFFPGARMAVDVAPGSDVVPAPG